MWKSLAHFSCYTFHFRGKNVYKPPDTTLFAKSVEMKFKVSRKIQWFEGQKTMYDGLTRKYGIYFPCDGETVYPYPNNKDLRSTWYNCITIEFTLHD